MAQVNDGVRRHYERHCLFFRRSLLPEAAKAQNYPDLLNWNRLRFSRLPEHSRWHEL